MSCPSLTFTHTYSIIGSGGISITIIVPEIYNCTNIQLRLKSTSGIIEDWFDYTVLNQLITTINFPVAPGVCYIDIRLNQCCGGPGPDLPPPSPDNPPPDDPLCAPIAISDDECGDEVAVTNPYVKPSDSAIVTPYNDIAIPKAVSVKITHNSCSDISALLCTVRCGDPLPPEKDGGICPCRFIPLVDIYSLPKLTIGRLPHGVPIDFDTLCNYDGGLRSRPVYEAPNYTKVEVYYKASYGYSAVPFIDGVGYDTTNLNISTWVKVHESDNSYNARNWLVNHFRFFGIDNNKTQITFVWPYTDLYWTPYDFCIPNEFFTPADKTAYVSLIPC